MTDQTEVSRYVQHAMSIGQTPEAIDASLRAAGWTETEVTAALAHWVPGGAAGPVPRPVRSTAARQAVLHALLFVALGVLIGHALAILFGLIDLWLSAPGRDNAYRATGLRWAMAAMVVFVPTFLALDRVDRRAQQADPARQYGAVWRWLSAVAILAAALSVLGDALWVVYTFLDGDLSLQFAAKAACVAGMAGLVLAYFRVDRRSSGARNAALALAGSAVLALVLAIWIIGGPAQGRADRQDNDRLGQLQIMSDWTTHCAALTTPLPQQFDPIDCVANAARVTPDTALITYRRLDDTRFRLCIPLRQPTQVSDPRVYITGDQACRDVAL